MGAAGTNDIVARRGVLFRQRLRACRMNNAAAVMNATSGASRCRHALPSAGAAWG